MSKDTQLTGDEAEGLLKVVTDYSLALSLLDQYDHQQLTIRDTTSPTPFALTYDAAHAAIIKMAAQSGMHSDLFGREKDQSFQSSIGAIYQTFGGRELYPSIEEKAAHLLYFVVKNHSFVDGNKRIAAFLFVWFLDANRILFLLLPGDHLGLHDLFGLVRHVSDFLLARHDGLVRGCCGRLHPCHTGQRWQRYTVPSVW